MYNDYNPTPTPNIHSIASIHRAYMELGVRIRTGWWTV